MRKIIFIVIFFSINTFGNQLPELGSTFDNLLSNKDEKKIKFQIMQQVYSSNSVINDPEITDYIDGFGKKLIESLPNEQVIINFFVVNDRSVNAFAMLGNIIGVNTGLILASSNESEIASVLAHEIAHVSQKHLLRLLDSQATNMYKSYFALAIAILAARSNPNLSSGAMVAASASQVQNLLDYTRDNEREADRIGLNLLEKSGFDPKGFIDFFSTIQRFDSFSLGPAPAFLRTHPVTTDRISDIQDRLRNFKYIQKPNKLEFYLIKAKLKAFIGSASEAENIFKKEIETNQFENKISSFYGLTYSLLRKKNNSEARDYFEKLKKLNAQSPMIYELEANLLISEKRYQEAFKLYKEALIKYPYNRAYIYGLSKLLLQFNKPDKTIEFIKNYLSYYKKDPELFQFIAKAYNQKEMYLLEHENLSDAFYFQYDIQGAITQMDLATKIDDNNFYDKSRVEYRLKNLMREADLMIN